MIGMISSFMTRVVSRYLPDPLVFALILTIVVFALGLSMGNSPASMMQMWGGGFWNLLAFTTQMAMVIVTGYALASSPLIKKILKACASLAKTPRQAVALVCFAGSVACVINWGFGLVVGALFAKEVARKLKSTDYGLLIACAYIGFMTWGGGLSGSMPLLAATPGNPVEKYVGGIIPISDTIFTHYNIFITLALIVLMPLLVIFMTPKIPKPIDPSLLAEDPSFEKKVSKEDSIAVKIEESKILNYIIVALGIWFLLDYFMKHGFNVTINTVNLIFIILGMLLHKTPMAYMRAVGAAAKSTAGILIQFPFYAGIALMMENSGIGKVITEWFVNIANKDTFAVLTFFSSAIINFAVPSGGGHWVIQGPFVIEAAKEVGAPLGKATMAIAYGEQWANMIQPFWALPALAIAGLGVRDIMGYCITALIFSVPIFVIGLYFLH
ncbi:TIGR00366 family protein [Helicobacter sp. 13S00401-1]|uniref:TIGR00366 family protein n=1 Tax=Helicobacter sp. 13S00401-1 TaxID=1905758 RepID=UPI000BA77030|nr:TIGR00366 family protein [Helicobacter sp. 13S00401-1]PAF51809.1 TIGR00366 family protein [Helicobacter sp. 13S00401-1]